MSGAVVDTIVCAAVLIGTFFILNGTSDSIQTNVSPAELETRKDSVVFGTGLVASALSVKSPIIEALADTYDCATGYCDPNLMLPGSAHPYADVAGEVVDDAKPLVNRTYTVGNESFEYIFDPNKPGALGYTEDLANLSPDDYNLLRVPDNIYAHTNIQRDFMRDIIESGIKPTIFSNPNDQPWRIFSRYEMRLLDRFERLFGDWSS